MIKPILASCSLVLILGVGSMSAALAQKPSPAPAAPTQPGISDEELKKFISIFKKLESISQESNSLVVQAVEKGGFNLNRFREIYMAKQNPSAKPATPISADEEKKYDLTITQLAQIQKEIQSKMTNAVQTEGLEVKRFRQILETVQKDPAMKKKVEQMLKSSSK
jgi:uncharacterized protein (UPF0335 family)